MGTWAWRWADNPTHWKCLWLFCPVCLSPWPASWVIASSHRGQQMCTAGGAAVSGIQLCASRTWAAGDGNLTFDPGCPLSLVVWPSAGPWPPWASVSSLIGEALHSFPRRRLRTRDVSGSVPGPGHEPDPVVPAFKEFMLHGELTLSSCSRFDELPGYKGINRKQLHFSPVTGPN